ncbi:MAG: hypothetical protein JMM75_02725 [Candidatus Xiphinematobacter sp.]|nr:MAG: hypothetical protein JMM75_02725 [Candidatus Xiphinematobacter sp.]QQY08522.1 MAG: hypothetical protein JMM79_00890 [Candidatus Xiphinematobacter sp.]QQY10010.1 MAG: hypothetical protein JMM78_00880 [Candidatus Xiphinematobacter sp.]QQY10741.1 MAG: hypothetical protein JMM74_00855 [Candidatus Xiphinematobacter sp.]
MLAKNIQKKSINAELSGVIQNDALHLVGKRHHEAIVYQFLNGGPIHHPYCQL